MTALHVWDINVRRLKPLPEIYDIHTASVLRTFYPPQSHELALSLGRGLLCTLLRLPGIYFKNLQTSKLQAFITVHSFKTLITDLLMAEIGVCKCFSA